MWIVGFTEWHCTQQRIDCRQSSQHNVECLACYIYTQNVWPHTAAGLAYTVTRGIAVRQQDTHRALAVGRPTAEICSQYISRTSPVQQPFVSSTPAKQLIANSFRASLARRQQTLKLGAFQQPLYRWLKIGFCSMHSHPNQTYLSPSASPRPWRGLRPAAARCKLRCCSPSGM